MPRFGFNGGLMGTRRVPATSSASGVWNWDEQSVAKRAGIWPFSGDQYWADVVLLISCDGSNGSTTFTDLSTYAHTISVGTDTNRPSNDANVSTSEKQFGTGSLAVGFTSGGFIETPASSAFSFPGDFTIELWAKFDATQPTGTTALLELNAYTDGIIIRSDGTWINGAQTVWTGLVNTNWRHLALSRSGSTIRWFRDGIADATTVTRSETINSANGKLRFGTDIHTGGGSPMKGYIDEIRVTKASRYQSNFTPPAAPFSNG